MNNEEIKRIIAKDTKYHTISVIISTFNRKRHIFNCLSAYEQQNFPKNGIELIIVDDGSDIPISSYIFPDRYNFAIKLFRQKHAGPAAARNLAIKNARNDIIIFTGDDIIPEKDFLYKHLNAHNQNTNKNVAILGITKWSPKIAINPVMHYITEIDGEQFAYFNITNPLNATYNFFYTSNISLKRRYLINTKEFFCEEFLEAAYEDAELGYRLEKKHALKIVYVQDIIAYHNHKITLQSFYRRQFNAGRMAMVCCKKHPEMFAGEITPELTSGCIYKNIPEELLFMHKQIEKIQKTEPKVENILKDIKYHFFKHVFEFAFCNGMQYALKQ